MAKRNVVAGTPADPTLRFAKLELDGEVYDLAYSFNAIAIAENVSGCNLLVGLENLTDLNAAQLRGLLYAALTVANPKITIQQAGHMIRLDTITAITSALADAYRLSLPEKLTAAANPPAAADAPADLPRAA